MITALAPYRKALVAYAGSVLAALALVAADGISLAELLAALGAGLVPGAGTYAVRNRRP